jgi:hypothetical protein
LSKAREQFADPGTARERIACIDDQILFKVKIQRWRGAVWPEPARSWLVAAGHRESGSAEDFYAALAASGRAARARYNAEHKPPLNTDTYTAHLLPDGDDRMRCRLEAAARFVRHLEAVIPDLVLRSLTKVILDIVPGCDPSGWYPEAALPDRRLRTAEQAWSNIMDPAAVAKLLDNADDDAD